MKNIIAIIPVAVCLVSCGTGTVDQKITSNVQTAATFAIKQVPPAAQTQVADYYDVAAVGIRSIDGTPTVQELTDKMLAFIPQNVRDQYPLIGSTIAGVVTFAYKTYGKAGLNDVANGLEAAAAPYITKH